MAYNYSGFIEMFEVNGDICVGTIQLIRYTFMNCKSISNHKKEKTFDRFWTMNKTVLISRKNNKTILWYLETLI